jgi:hypothetical protein
MREEEFRRAAGGSFSFCCGRSLEEETIRLSCVCLLENKDRKEECGFWPEKRQQANLLVPSWHLNSLKT